MPIINLFLGSLNIKYHGRVSSFLLQTFVDDLKLGGKIIYAKIFIKMLC